MSALPMSSSVGPGGRVPESKQNSGVIVQDTLLVIDDGVDEASDRFRWMSGCGFGSQEVGESGLAEEVAVLISSLGDPSVYKMGPSSSTNRRSVTRRKPSPD